MSTSRRPFRGLEKRGIDALTVADAGLLGTSDEELLAFASEEKRVVVTQDPDFLEIASRTSDHPGIVFLPQDRPLGEIVRLLDLLVQVSDAEEMQGRVEYI
jgi:predicted nuclease of predicted toxin-antitoxin system